MEKVPQIGLEKIAKAEEDMLSEMATSSDVAKDSPKEDGFRDG